MNTFLAFNSDSGLPFGFSVGIIVILAIITLLVKGLIRAIKGPKQDTTTPTSPTYITVSNEVMNAAFPDRSAGRECTVCNQHGTHHTDQHNTYAKAALERATPANED